MYELKLSQEGLKELGHIVKKVPYDSKLRATQVGVAENGHILVVRKGVPKVEAFNPKYWEPAGTI